MSEWLENERFSAYLDGELSAEEQSRVEQLLATNPEARQLVDQLRTLGTRLGSLPQESLGVDLSEAVLRQAELEKSRPPVDAPSPAGNRDALPEEGFWKLAGRRLLEPRNYAWSAIVLLVAAGLLWYEAHNGPAPGPVAMVEDAESDVAATEAKSGEALLGDADRDDAMLNEVVRDDRLQSNLEGHEGDYEAGAGAGFKREGGYGRGPGKSGDGWTSPDIRSEPDGRLADSPYSTTEPTSVRPKSSEHGAGRTTIPKDWASDASDSPASPSTVTPTDEQSSGIAGKGDQPEGQVATDDQGLLVLCGIRRDMAPNGAFDRVRLNQQMAQFKRRSEVVEDLRQAVSRQQFAQDSEQPGLAESSPDLPPSVEAEIPAPLESLAGSDSQQPIAPFQHAAPGVPKPGRASTELSQYPGVVVVDVEMTPDELDDVLRELRSNPQEFPVVSDPMPGNVSLEKLPDAWNDTLMRQQAASVDPENVAPSELGRQETGQQAWGGIGDAIKSGGGAKVADVAKPAIPAPLADQGERKLDKLATSQRVQFVFQVMGPAMMNSAKMARFPSASVEAAMEPADAAYPAADMAPAEPNAMVLPEAAH